MKNKKVKKRNCVEFALQVGEHGAKARTQEHADKRNKREKKHKKNHLKSLVNSDN